MTKLYHHLLFQISLVCCPVCFLGVLDMAAFGGFCVISVRSPMGGDTLGIVEHSVDFRDVEVRRGACGEESVFEAVKRVEGVR